MKYHKKTQTTGTHVHLHSTQLNYNPFLLRDNSYLEHLHKELKLRQSREAMLSLRKDMIESNKRSNYQNELDRLTNEISRPNLPYPTKQHLEHRVKQLKSLGFLLNILIFS